MKWEAPEETKYGPGWILGTLDGKPAFSDGCAMFVGKRKGSVIKPEDGFGQALAKLLPCGGKPLQRKAYKQNYSNEPPKVLRGKIIVQTLYEHYAESHFNGVKFFASKGNEAVICKVGEKVVGVIMACRW